MKLAELEPQFLRYAPRDGQEIHEYVDTVAEADGVMFLCPKCFEANGGAVGTHGVLCWFIGKVPDHVDPKPGRWNAIGTGYADLTLRAGSSSILLTSGCRWHGYVTAGDVTSC